MKHKKILTFVFVLAFALRIIFVFLTPIFEKPDEKGHFEYIKYLAENKKLPVAGHFFSEYFQPPLYYIITAFIFQFMNIFTQDIWYHVIFFRVISVIFSMITLYLTFKIASLVFKEKDLVIGVVAFAALLPSHINVNSNTTNANLSQVFATLIIYLLLKNITKIKNKINLVIGVLAGLAILTRPSEIASVLTIPLAYLIKYFPNIKKSFKPIMLVALMVLAVSGWHLIRNFIFYGDIFAYNAMKWSTPPDNTPKDLIFAARLLGWTFVTFWVTFGRTNNVVVGNFTSTTGMAVFFVFYSILLLISLFSFIGLHRLAKKYLKNKKMIRINQKKSLIVLAFHIIILLLLFINFNLYNLEPQGRLLFPAISAISVFFTLGIYSLFNTNNKKKFLQIYLNFFILINLISVITALMHYIRP